MLVLFGVAALLVSSLIKKKTNNTVVLSSNNIQIQTGDYANLEELMILLKQFIYKPLNDINVDKMQEILEGHPWIFNVMIVIRSSGNFEIKVSERNPIAIVDLDGIWVVDSFGFPFKKAESDWEFSLPLIDQKSALEIIKTYEYINKPIGAISEIREQFSDRYQIKFLNGLEVIVGKKNLLEQFEKLVSILISLKNLKNNLAFLCLDDILNNENQIAIRFKNEAI